MDSSKKNKISIPLKKGIFAKKYKILEKLGQGQMSIVHRAINVNLNQEVTIKFPRILSPTRDMSRKFLLQGAKLLARLHHPHIARIFDADQERGIPYVVMELVKGKELDKLISPEKPLGLSRVFSLAISLAQALEYAHEQKVVHRDIQPRNILVSDQDHPCLVGFDLASLSTGAHPLDAHQLSSRNLEYLAPELLLAGEGNHQVDIWSLGATIFFMLTGHSPFSGANREEVMDKLQDPLYSPFDQMETSLSAGLIDVLSRMMERNLKKRFTSMKAIGQIFVNLSANLCSKKATELIVDTWSSPAELNQLLISSTGDEYQIIEKRGRGTFGMVYKAQDKKLNRTVALKILRTEYISNREVVLRFQREAQAMSAIRHPNVVEIYSVGELEGVPFFVMPFIGEEDLEKVLERELHFSIEESLKVLYYILQGLTAAHEAGVVHRDLKPANILLTDKNVPVITDFGVAYVMTNQRLTQEITLMGTLLYMAPEQANSTEVDERSDLYALGIMLYEMLCGTPPFVGSTPVELIQKITTQPPPPMAEFNLSLPQEVEDFLFCLLEKKPEDRYKSAREAGNILRDLLTK